MSEKKDKVSDDDITGNGKISDSELKEDLQHSENVSSDQLEEALTEKEQFKRLAQRAQADLINYRRRIEGEQESSRLRNQQRIVLKFASVIDQLDVALKADGASSANSSWFKGVEAIYKNFLNTLASEGFEKFESIGEEFDPRKHEAMVSTVSVDHAPNTVINELLPGYMHNNEVVRAAQVEIAVPPDGDDEKS
ncbi:MAG: nucleotide exchange factor GrpE [SAR202 cluster bacterium]|nr:nucleotide exchange factor GrpE [SAR202 cluster bacterium]